MSYCKNCGKELEDEVITCPHCQNDKVSFDNTKNKSLNTLNLIAKRKIIMGLFLIVVILGGGFLYYYSQNITIDETTADGDYNGDYNLLTKSGTITLKYNNNNTHIADENEYTIPIKESKFKINVNGKYNNNGTWTNNITGRIDENGEIITHNKLNTQNIGLYSLGHIGHYTGNYDPNTRTGTITYYHPNNKDYLSDEDSYTVPIIDSRFKISITGTYIGMLYHYPWTNNITGYIDENYEVIASVNDGVDFNRHL